MKQIPIMEDGVTSLNATYFNDIPRELENLIQAAGIALSGADLNQTGKAVSVFVAGSDYYDCANVVDAYALSAVESFQRPPAYFVGYRARFKASATNTTVAPTVNIGAIGAVELHLGHLEDAATPAVAIGDIAENQVYEIVYSLTDDNLTYYWRIVNGASTQTRTLYTGSDGSTLELLAGVGSPANGVRYDNKTTGVVSYLNQLGCGATNPSDASYTSQSTFVTGKGISYLFGPGGGDVEDVRVAKAVTGVGSMSWAKETGNSIYSSTDNITLVGIPSDAVFLGFTLRYIDDLDKPVSCPMHCTINPSGANPVIETSYVLSPIDPTLGGYTDHSIVFSYATSDVV